MEMHIKSRQDSIRYAIATAFVAGSALLGMPDHAATAAASFGVGATVTSTCTVSGTALDADRASGSRADVTGALTFTCSKGSFYALGLSGNSSGATSSAVPSYSLSARKSDGTVWQDTSGITVSAGTGNAQTVSVSGVISRGADSAPAQATGDVITATIVF